MASKCVNANQKRGSERKWMEEWARETKNQSDDSSTIFRSSESDLRDSLVNEWAWAVGAVGEKLKTPHTNTHTSQRPHTHTYSRTAPGHTEVGLGARSPPHTNDLIYYILVSINYDYLFGDDGAIIFSTMYNIRFFFLFLLASLSGESFSQCANWWWVPIVSASFSFATIFAFYLRFTFIWLSFGHRHPHTTSSASMHFPFRCLRLCACASVLRFVFFSIRKCFAYISPTTTHC